jgi:A/G-specific adenine glycosylase
MGFKKASGRAFAARLLQWHHSVNQRKMPWKGVKDPYRVWLSEVILQQTRVEQGLAYYERFIETYPTIHDLAQAPDDEVFKLWEGLGYYSRCRNLLKTARYIAYELEGAFPSTYHSILALTGIGPYTAAAIASFAFDLPYAVVDGNVIRVLSRYFGIEEAVDLPETRKRLNVLAQDLIDQTQPAAYNQAIMDFGATVCKPRQPLCGSCPFKLTCVALKKNRVEQIPFKSKKLVRSQRFFHYIIFEFQRKVYIRKRLDKDIWQGLFEFFLLEADQLLTTEAILASNEMKRIAGKGSTLVYESMNMKQQLTHQEIIGKFVHVRLASPAKGLEHMTAVDLSAVRKLAFPKFIVSFMHEKL